MKLSESVKEVLIKSGWTPERDVFSKLELSPQKQVFPAAKEILSNYGLLKLCFDGRSGGEKIYFDVDDSEHSKNMRAQIFGYESYLDEKLIQELDWNEYENFASTEIAQREINMPCCRIGYFEDENGFDLYVSEDESIYAAHSDIPQKVSNSIVEFLNQVIKG